MTRISVLLLIVFWGVSLMSSQAESLSDALEQQAKISAGKIPAEAQAVMQAATEELEKSEILAAVIKRGDVFPDGEYQNSKGEKLQFSTVSAGKAAVVAFYRGGWCPYCNLQLHHLQQAMPEFEKLGATLIAISPESPSSASDTTLAQSLTFPVLSDVSNVRAKEIGLVFELPQSLREVYLNFGIDLQKSQDNDSWELPLAATFLLDSERKVRYRFVDTDYRKRASIEELLENLKSLNG